MKADYPLSQEFIIRYPVEAARVLEQLSTKHVAALLAQLPAATCTPVIETMLPRVAADCLNLIDVTQVAKIITETSLNTMARIYRLLSTEQQDVLYNQLPDKLQSRLHKYLSYPASSAGALMDPNVDTLPANIAVADAIRRLERLRPPAHCEIFIADDTHHLVGSIALGKLLTCAPQNKLRDVINKKTRSISVHASSEPLLKHPGWKTHRTLPVVDRDNTLVGVLHFSQLQDLTETLGTPHAYDPMNSLLSLASLYWISLAQLLDSLMGISQTSQEKQP